MFIRPVRKMRNIFASLRGGEHPAEIAAGVCLGLFLGLTPFGLHLLIPVLVLLVFRCSTGLAFFSMAISKGLYLMLAGPFYYTGFYLLHDTQIFDGLIRVLMQTPVIGFMGFNQYLLFGSYVICFAASIVLFPLVYILVKQFRHRFLAWIKQPAWMQSFIRSTIGSWIIWLCFGNPGDQEEDEDTEETGGIGRYFGFLRLKVIGGLAGAVLLVCVITVLGYGLSFTALTSSALSNASGVDVRVETASFSPFTGRMSIREIAGADPSSETEDLFQVEQAVLDLNMYRILAGKMHVSEISLNKLLLNVRRNEDGSLNIEEIGKQPEEETQEDVAEDEQTYKEWLKEKGREVDWIELVKKYSESLMDREPAEDREEEADEQPKREPPEPGVEYRDGQRVVVFDPDAAYQYEDRIPLVHVRTVEINDAEVGLTDETAPETGKDLPALEKISGRIGHISSAPALLDQPIKVVLDGQFDGSENETISIDSTYHPERKKSLNAILTGLNLKRLRPIYQNTIPVQVRDGKLTTTVKGNVENGQIDAPAALSMANLKLQKKEDGQRLFGMEPDTSQYILEGINAYAEEEPIAFDFLVDGPVNNPRFHWKAQFLAVARKGLKSLGKQVAQKHIQRINGELENMKGKVKDTVKNEVEDISEGALESVKSGDTDKLKEQLESSGDAVEDLKDKDLDDFNPFGGD